MSLPSATSILITWVSDGIFRWSATTALIVALAVVRLLAEQDQLGLLGLEQLRERVAGRVNVRALERGVAEVDGAVGAQGDGLVQRSNGAVRAHRHGDDLLDIGHAALANLHRGFDAVGVERAEVLLAGAVQTLAFSSIRFWTAASGTSLTRQQIFKSEPPWEWRALGES